MDASTRVLAELLSRVRGREAKQVVKAKITECKCLQCDQSAVVGCRGLCEFHHGQFKYARSLAAKEVTISREEQRRGITLPMKVKEAKLAVDQKWVASGWILASQQGKHGKTNPFIAGGNPFRVTA